MRASVASLLLLTLASLCAGCVVVPVPASGKTASCGKRISKEDASFIKIGQTTRDEVTTKFGQPFEICEEQGAIAYDWVVIAGYWYGIVGYGPGLACGRDEIERNEMLLVQFDQSNCVRRFEFRRLPHSQAVKDFLSKWAVTKNQ